MPLAEEEPGRAWARVKLLLALVACAHAIWPLFRDPALGWPLAPARRLGLFVVLAGFLPYAFRRKAAVRSGADLVLLIASPLYLLAIGNGLTLTSGDNLATRALGPSIVQRGTLDISAYPPFDVPPLEYAAMKVGARALPAFPLGTGLLTVPYAAVAVTLSRGRVDVALLARWEKHVAALFGVAAALLFFLGVRRRFGERAAVGCTFTLVLATPFLSSVTQALWATTGEVLLTCAVLALVLPEEGSLLRHAAAGLAMGGAFLCRPTAAIPILAIGWALLPRRRKALAFLLSSGVAIVAVSAWMLALYNHPLGGYGLLNVRVGAWRLGLPGLPGVLFSPSRGLLVFFPYLLLLPPLLMRRRLDAGAERWVQSSLGCLVLLVLLVSGYAKWWGGHSLGPRLLTEAAPFLALATIPAWREERARSGSRVAFLVALAFASLTQLLLTYNLAAARWNDVPEVDENPARLWSVRSSQLSAAWGIGP